MRALLAVAAATAGTSALGFAIGLPWILPALSAAPAFVILIRTLSKGSRGRAVGLIIWWALCLALSDIALTMMWHDRAAAVILNGAAYRDEMFAWISTGVGRESTPWIFIPQHALHAGLFCLLSLLTGGLVSLVMGALLMNYMSFYVADLLRACSGSAAQGTAILIAWNPWSMVRVCAFIVLGVVLAEPLLSRFRGSWPSPEGRLRWAAAGAAGLLIDIVLKAWLAPKWPGLLAACLG